MLIFKCGALGADYMESFQPGLSFIPVSRVEISARFELPGLKIQPGLKKQPFNLNGFILRAGFIFKYFTYNHSLTQVK